MTIKKLINFNLKTSLLTSIVCSSISYASKQQSMEDYCRQTSTEQSPPIARHSFSEFGNPTSTAALRRATISSGTPPIIPSSPENGRRSSFNPQGSHGPKNIEDSPIVQTINKNHKRRSSILSQESHSQQVNLSGSAPEKMVLRPNLEENKLAYRNYVIQQIYDLKSYQDMIFSILKVYNTDIIKVHKEMLDKFHSKNISERCIEAVLDPEVLLNRLTALDAKTFSNICNLLYKVNNLKPDDAKQQKKVLENKIKTFKDTRKSLIDNKESFTRKFKKLTLVTKDNAQDSKKLLEKEITFLENLIGFKCEKDVSNYLNVCQELDKKIADIEENITKYKSQLEANHNITIESVQALFKGNTLLDGYKILEILNRNTNEFSGIAAYNEISNKLIVAFVGSVSRKDWYKNFQTESHKFSSNHGLLTNIKVLKGMASHLDDNYDQYYKFINPWLEAYQTKVHSSKLEIDVIGHSLGGSLAEIFGAVTNQLCLFHKIEANLGIVTFGSPNIFFKKSIEQYLKYVGGPGKIIRFANSKDKVVTIFTETESPASVTVKFTPSDDDDRSLFPLSPASRMLAAHSSRLYYHDFEEAYKKWELGYQDVIYVAKDYSRLKKGISDSTKQFHNLSSQINDLILKLEELDIRYANLYKGESQQFILDKIIEKERLQKVCQDMVDQLTALDNPSHELQQNIVEKYTEIAKSISEIEEDVSMTEESVSVWTDISNSNQEELKKISRKLSQDYKK